MGNTLSPLQSVALFSIMFVTSRHIRSLKRAVALNQPGDVRPLRPWMQPATQTFTSIYCDLFVMRRCDEDNFKITAVFSWGDDL